MSTKVRSKSGTKNGLKSSLKNGKVSTRDGEIDRLSHLLEGGRPYDVVALEAKNRSNERLISHLNIQIDYLQQKNADLQKNVDETWDKARKASLHTTSLGSRNLELESELETVDRLAQRLQSDRDATVRAAGREIEETKMELDKAKAEVARLDALLNNTSADKDDLQTQHVEMQEIVDKVQDDKKKLATRVTKLIATEKELVLELDKAKHGRNGTRKSKNTAAIESLLQQLEEDRDYWKGEAALCGKLLRSQPRATSPTAKSPTRSRSPGKNMMRSRSPSPNKSSKEAKLQAVVKRLEEDLLHAQHENEILRSMNNRPNMSSSKLSKREADSIDVEGLIQERDELRGMINKFERHMAEIQANVKVLTTERDKLDCMYQKGKEELAYLRKEIVKSPQKPRTSVAAQAVLRRVENERDDAIAELRKAAAERDTLRERLKIATNSHLNDRANLEQRIEDLERLLQEAESQSGQSDAINQELEENVDRLESELADKSQRLEEAKNEIKQNKMTISHLKNLLDEAENSLKDTQGRLQRRNEELNQAKDRLYEQDQMIAALQEQAGHDTLEMGRLKSAMNSLDKAKDELQNELDEKTLRMEGLEEDLRHRDRQVGDLRVTVQDLDNSIQRLNNLAADKDHEIASLHRQADDARAELTDVGRAREAAMRENRRLQDDLGTMTRENQNLNQDLADASQERSKLKDAIQDYLVQLTVKSDLLSAKEKELKDLCAQYRNLNVEAEQYQTQSHNLESETSTLRLEIMTKDSEIRRLRELMENLETEIRQHQKTLRSYELQISEQTKNVAGLEMDLRQSEQQRQTIQQDLFAVRDLCARLERTKEELQRQLNCKGIDTEKLQALVEDLQSESGTLRAQVGNERDNVYSLEGLIQSNREKEYSTALSLQEKEAEIQRLKDMIAIDESKLESQNRDVCMSRNRALELESDVDRLKRSLTNERFERERMAQELRRSGLVVPGESRLSRSVVTEPPLSPRQLSPRQRSPRQRSPRNRSGSRSPFRYTCPP